MDNVNDLKNTTDRIVRNTPTQQPISLSAVSNNTDTQQTSVSINATNGLTGVQNTPETERQVVRVNPNPGRKKVARRTVNNSSELNTVDPNEIIPYQPHEQPITPRDKAMNLLADAVERKQREYKEFVESAIEADKENREKVEAGLETVNGEMQYMPDDLHVPMSKDEEVHALGYVENEDEDFFSEDENSYNEEEYDDEDSWDEDEENFDAQDITVPVQNTRIVANDFFNEEPEESYEQEDDGYIPDDEDSWDEDEEDFYDEEEESHYTGIGHDDSVEIDATSSEFIPEEEPQYADLGHTDSNEIESIFSDAEEHEKEDKQEEDLAVFDPEYTNIIAPTISEEVTTEDFDIDDTDFKDVDSTEDDEEESLTDEEIEALDEAAANNLRSEILKKIVNVGKRVDASQFTVSNKVVPLKNAMRNIKKIERTASWPMMFAGRPFVASSLKGPEIAVLADLEDNNNTNLNITREQARIIYDHDANPHRPATLEAWCKTIPLMDLDSIFAALYCASMKSANYLPMVCPKNSCRHAYLSDDISIESMLKFEKDDSKKKFDAIKKIELTADNSSSYESVVTVINENFAVGIKMPSLFNALYEYSSLSPEFIEKYASIIAVLQYVDYVYLIDPETSQLQPIGWKTYHGDYGKTYKSKISTYSRIFKEFSSTEFTLMASLIDSIVLREAESKVYTLEVPAAKCPKCGTEIVATPMTARQVLFTQQRLVGLATTPIER